MALDQDEILDEGEEEEVNWMAVIIAAVVVLVIIGGAAWFFFIREVPESEAKFELPKWVPPPEGFAEETVNDFLPTMIINPADSRGRYFLVVKLDFVLNDPGVVAGEVYGKPWRLAQVKNIIIDIFSSYTTDELKMPKYKEETRQKIWEELNGLTGWVPSDQPLEEGYDDPNPPPIKAIYFSQYILQ